MAWTLTFYCLAVVGASFLGGLLPLATIVTHTRLQVYLSFASGAMLGASLLHMLPEAVELGGPDTLRWVVAGLIALFLLERFFSYHQHEIPEDSGHDHGHEHEHDHRHGPAAHVPARGWQWGAAAFGLAVHTIVGGIALASAAAVGAGRGHGAAGWGVFVATVIHKPADALTITSLMVRAGASKRLAHAVNLGFSLMFPIGVALFVAGRSWAGPDESAGFTASTLAFSAGTFLCIALSDLMPELHFHAHDRVKLSIALLAGLGLMAGAGLWE